MKLVIKIGDPFGMGVQGRSLASSSPRFDFNAQLETPNRKGWLRRSHPLPPRYCPLH